MLHPWYRFFTLGRLRLDIADESNPNLVSIMNHQHSNGPRDDDSDQSQADLDNHANQLNPNNDAYWDSRGGDGRPDDWEERKD